MAYENIPNVVGTRKGSITNATNIATASAIDTVISNINNKLSNLTTDCEVTMETNSSPSDTSLLKVYSLYQGLVGTETAEQKAAKKIGDINIPKDLVVTGGAVVTLDANGKDPTTGYTAYPDPAGTPNAKYLRITIANQAAPVYIAVNDLVDVYTGSTDAAGITISISNANVISATLNKADGSKVELTKIDGTTKITAQSAYAEMNATTTASTATADTTSADNGISVVTEVTQVNGVVSMTTAKADKYGAASKALTDAKSYTDTEIGKLDVDSTALFSEGTGADANKITIKAIKEVDGKIATDTTAANTVTLAAVAKTGTAADVAIVDADSVVTATTVEGAIQEIATEIDGMDAVADATKTAIDGSTARTASDNGVFVLQSITEADGKITGMGVAEVDSGVRTALAALATTANNHISNFPTKDNCTDDDVWEFLNALKTGLAALVSAS